MLRDGMVGKRVLPMTNFSAPCRRSRPPTSTASGPTPGGRWTSATGTSPSRATARRPATSTPATPGTPGALRGLGPRFRQLTLPATRGRRRARWPASPRPSTRRAGCPSPGSSPSPGATCAAGTGDTGAEQALSLDLGAGITVPLLDALDGRRARAAGRPLPDGQPGPRRPPVALPGRRPGPTSPRRGAPPAAFVLATGPELWRVAGTTDQPDTPFAVSKCEADPAEPGQLDGAHRGGGRLRARHRAVRAADAAVRPQGRRHRLGPAGGRRRRAPPAT